MSRASPEHAMRETLAPLCALLGVRDRYTDGLGQRRRAPLDSTLATVRAMGVEAVTVEGLSRATRALAVERLDRTLEPVTLAWGGKLSGIAVRLPRGERARDAHCELALEDGGVVSWKAALRERAPSRAERQAVDAGARIPVRLFICPGPKGAAPMGVHTLRMRVGAMRAESRVIAAPRRAFGAERPWDAWGVFLPLYALTSERSPDIADLTDLRALRDWASSLGSSFVGTLPLFASYLDEPFDPSPYAPVSRAFWNELYLDTGGSRGSGPPDTGSLVEYRGVYARKRAEIDAIAAREMDRASAGSGALWQRIEEDRLLDQYACFRALVERRRAGWRSWPDASDRAVLDQVSPSDPSYLSHAYAQLAMRDQMGALTGGEDRGGLYLDLPLGVHSDGFDAWRFRGQLLEGLSVGAPPDPLFTAGQSWGFAPACPRVGRERCYPILRESLETLMRVSCGVRIDHVMGLHRLFVVPAGFGAKEGLYIQQSLDEQLALVCLLSHRERCRVVGENLGAVPPVVTRTMRTRGVLGMHVAQFAVRADARRAMDPAPAGTLASLNTHDVPPFAAWWRGADIDIWRSLGLMDEAQCAAERAGRVKTTRALSSWLARRAGGSGAVEGELPAMRAVTRALAGGDADALLVTLEDLWGETRPQNVPGTSFELPNWRRRASLTLEGMMADSRVAETLREVHDIRASRRNNTKRTSRRRIAHG